MAETRAEAAEELLQWKSHIGLSLSSDRRILKATAKGWGRSGALTDPVLTRTGTLEGFLAALPQNTASLFIGFSNLSGSLYDHSRAHQEDLDFSIRVSSAGELSYQSKARMMQYAYSPHLESDTVCTVEKGDVVGMRLTPDRRGIQIIKEEEEEDKQGPAGDPAAAAEGGGSGAAAGEGGEAATKRIRVLKTFPEVMSFPFKVGRIPPGPCPPPPPHPLPRHQRVSAPRCAASTDRASPLLLPRRPPPPPPRQVMVVFGGLHYTIGPVRWLVRPSLANTPSQPRPCIPRRLGAPMTPQAPRTWRRAARQE